MSLYGDYNENRKYSSALPQVGGCSSCGGHAYGDTVDYCSLARQQLGTLSGNPTYWNSVDCNTIRNKICSDPTIFTGNDPIRLWANCGGIAPGGAGDNTLLYVIGGLVVVGAIIAVSRTRKTVIIKG